MYEERLFCISWGPSFSPLSLNIYVLLKEVHNRDKLIIVSLAVSTYFAEY